MVTDGTGFWGGELDGLVGRDALLVLLTSHASDRDRGGARPLGPPS